MNLADSEFKYSVVLRVLPDAKLELTELLPHAQEVSLSSRTFINYNECVTSCKGLLQDIVATMNDGDRVFKVGAEVNPIFSGQPTLSKDWFESEVARFWIYDKAQEGAGAKIDGIARTSIFAVPRTEARSLN